MTQKEEMAGFTAILDRAASGARLSADEALTLADAGRLEALMPVAASLRDAGHGPLVSYSKKVFIPLTQLCRDVCHYCTFAHPPRRCIGAGGPGPCRASRNAARRAG